MGPSRCIQLPKERSAAASCAVETRRRSLRACRLISAGAFHWAGIGLPIVSSLKPAGSRSDGAASSAARATAWTVRFCMDCTIQGGTGISTIGGVSSLTNNKTHNACVIAGLRMTAASPAMATASAATNRAFDRAASRYHAMTASVERDHQGLWPNGRGPIHQRLRLRNQAKNSRELTEILPTPAEGRRRVRVHNPAARNRSFHRRRPLSATAGESSAPARPAGLAASGDPFGSNAAI